MELAHVPLLVWVCFGVFVLAMLALDLGVFHRKAHQVGLKEALTWSGVWIGLALVFNLGVYLFWDRLSVGSELSNSEAAVAWFAGYLVEYSLSIDNIFVFLVVFGYFNVPARYQHRVLFWGILGALVFRALFISAGAAILDRFAWAVLVFGAFLVVTAVRMVVSHGKEIEPEKNPIIRLFRRFVPVSQEYHGQKFFTHVAGKRVATPLFVALLFVEVTDIVFAVDSIPAIFAITREPMIVFTSNVFAILGLRSLFFALSGLVTKVRYLSYGLAAVLAFVGGKMVWTYAQHTWLGNPDFKVPISVSLGVIVLILGLTVALSLVPNRKARHAKAPQT